MRRVPTPRLALFASILTVLPARPAVALEWSFAAGTGAVVPVGAGELQEGVSTGFTATAAATVALGNGFELGGRFAFDRFPRDDDGVLRKSGIEQRPLRLLEVSGGTLTGTQGQLDLRYFPAQGRSSNGIHPCLTATTGVAVLDLEAAEFSYAYAGHTWPARVDGERGTHFVLGIGAGVRFDLGNRFHLMTEGRYEIVFRPEEAMRSIPLRLELAVDG